MTTKKKPELFTKVVEEYLLPNWKLIPSGSKFTGTIEGKKSEGRIMKVSDDEIYLCQNTINGMIHTEKLGYKYTFHISDGSKKELKDEEVVIKSITLDPTFKAPIYIKIGEHYVQFNKNTIKVGCTTVSNKIVREIVKQLKD